MSDQRPSAKDVIKVLLLVEPDLSASDLHERLHGLGVKVSSLTASSIRSEFLHSLSLLRRLGLLRDKSIAKPAWLRKRTLKRSLVGKDPGVGHRWSD